MKRTLTKAESDRLYECMRIAAQKNEILDVCLKSALEVTGETEDGDFTLEAFLLVRTDTVDEWYEELLRRLDIGTV